MKNQLQMAKKVFKWIMACLGRGLIVLIPLGYVTMLLLDVTVFAHYHYKDVTEIVWLECLGGLFYLVCLWCILTPVRRGRWIVLFVLWILIEAFVSLNSDLKKIYQHSKCLESSSIACPKDVVLNGG